MLPYEVYRVVLSCSVKQEDPIGFNTTVYLPSSKLLFIKQSRALLR